ncbi:MAG TPA: glycosyltransferase [Bacteroidota bacterium]|nr:glycosyltransferase [Bacteroidota bacterium]
MKILWLSNKILSHADVRGTGTWLNAMARGLLESGGIELGNISEGPVGTMMRSGVGNLTQWTVPHLSWPATATGVPGRTHAERIVRAIESFQPDLIHVWGTEGYWGLISARMQPGVTALLEMQGLKLAIARVYAGGLSLREQIACIGVKEIVRGTSIFSTKHRYERWGKIEREIIRAHRHIAVQTEWVSAQVKAINSGAQLHSTTCLLREAFTRAQPWTYTGRHVVFCSASYAAPFKGLHSAVRAVAELKRTLPDIELRIAGAHRFSGVRRDGYVAWVWREIERLGLKNHVTWLGALSAGEIVDQMRNSSAMLIPTYIENCCLAMQEAMYIGIPVIATYAGGLPSLARNEVSALFFPPGDEIICAGQLERAITDRITAESLSYNSRAVARVRNAPKRAVANQLELYRSIIQKNGEGTNEVSEGVDRLSLMHQ